MDSLRSSDRYYRFGGEEFVIILPHSEIADALLVAERIRVLVETRPVEFGEFTIPVTLSIGISCIEEQAKRLMTSSPNQTERCTWPRNPAAIA